MPSSVNPPIFYAHEHYSCPLCDKPLASDDIADDWRCKKCNSAVWIYAETATGIRHVLNRVRPVALRPGDLVVMPASNLKFVYPIISYTLRSTDVRIALRGYGVVNFPVYDLIEIVIGGWKESSHGDAPSST